MASEFVKEGSVTISCNGIDVAYEASGPAEAPAVILIHAFPFNRTMWAPQVEALEASYRVITYDLRGHGATALGDAPYSMGRFAADLIALMDALGIEKATLCGLSMGGYVALRAIRDFPQRFDALILANTRCEADSNVERHQRMSTISAIREDGVDCFAMGYIDTLFIPNTLTANPGVVRAVKLMIMNTEARTLENTLRALRERESTCDSLQAIAVPTLILVGERDNITPPANSQYLREHIPNADLVVIKHAAHLSNLENPKAFNAALETFLTNLS